MATSTLAKIKQKIRRLTASPSPSQLSENSLEEYIDTFFDQDFPAHLKLWNLHDTYTFFTTPNEDRYTFDTDLYQGVVPPVFVDGYQVNYSQSNQDYFNRWPRSPSVYSGPSGDGSAGPYTFTISGTPILKRQVSVSVVSSAGDTLTAYDVPSTSDNTSGTWVDAGTETALTGSINYITGVCTITWSTTVDSDESHSTRYVEYTAGRPTDCLFFSNYFTLRPIPDKAYRVTMDVYKSPSQLLSADSHDDDNTPDVKQWWQYIAFGAAIKVLQDRQDVESIQNILPFFKEQENLVIYRTALQQGPERTKTIYDTSLNQSGGSQGWGGW